MKLFLKTCFFLCVLTAGVFSQDEIINDFSINDPYWRQALGGAVLSLPHVQAQSAVIAVDGGSIKAYSAGGIPMWSFFTGGRISPFITRSREGTSYLSRTNGTLIAINRSGRELWRRSMGGPLAANSVIGWDGRIFAPLQNKILCYTASGNLLWEKEFEHSLLTPVKLDRNGGIIFALDNNHVYRLDPFGNAQVYACYGTPCALLSFDDMQILVLYRDRTMELLGSSADWFLSASGGASIAVLPVLPAAPVAAVNRGDYAAITLEDGKIVLVSVGERKILWEGNTHLREASSFARTEVEMLFDERGVYVLSKEGASGFTIDGRRLWYTLLQNAAAIPAFGEDGVLYSGGNDWILYAYKIEERVLQTRGGIFGPVPEGSYGLGRPHPIYMSSILLSENEIKSRLDQIEDAVNSGRVGSNEPSWTTFLLTTATGTAPIQSKIKAIQLLGQLGSRETVSFLMGIFSRESEPLIKAAAASAVGNIGVDPEGIAMQTFLYSLVPGGVVRDEQVLLAITMAAGSLCRFSGPPLSDSGIRILNLLTENPNPAIVRRQALREIESLR